MSGTLRVVCEPDLAPGFALAGLAAETLTRDAAASATPASLLGREAGVLLLQEQVYEALPADLRARLDHSVTPVVVPFPGPAWAAPLSAEERVVELLRRAIGYRVKLR